ncbi:MAG: efflux RND transporter periplasmic adaptor subunit [Balneolaceae bacterium]
MKKRLQLVLVVLLFVWGCSTDESLDNANENNTIPSVEAVQARFGSLPLEERLSGIVEAQNQVDIYSRIAAPVEEVYVQNGVQVEKGDPLVRLRDNEYRERVRQAEANLRINKAQERQARASLGEVESQMRRQVILDERDLSSEIEMEQLEAELESAEANLELALAQVEQAESSLEEEKDALSQTVIRAPITGTVGQRNVEPGMQVNTSSQLFTLGNLNDSKVIVNLTERMLGYITQGQSVDVYSESMDGERLQGEVSRISPFLGAGSFSTEAEIDIANTRDILMPGMFVTVDIFYGESEQATIIPLSAIYRHPRTGEDGVYVAPGFGADTEPLEQVDSSNPPPLSDPTAVEFVPINIIAKGRQSVGVTGIESGDWVISVGQNLLEGEGVSAKIRAVSWNRVMNMQNMRPQDLLRSIMEQRELANQQSTDSSQES